MALDSDPSRPVLETPAPSVDRAQAAAVASRYFGIEAEAERLGGERDSNFRLDAADGRRYVLKLANPAEDREVLEFENAAMAHIERAAAELPVPRIVPTTTGEDIADVAKLAADGPPLLARVFTWLGGVPLVKAKARFRHAPAIGRQLAEVGRALRGFSHPASGRTLLWDLQQAASLRPRVEALDTTELARACGDELDRFEAQVQPRLSSLRAQVIHNDFNPSNLLVEEGSAGVVTGILDFGDMVHAPLVCDVAVAAAYQIPPDGDPLAGTVELVSAYHRVTPLETEELRFLLDLIRLRLVQSATIGAWRARLYPENRSYIMRNASKAEGNLKRLAGVSREEAQSRFADACGPPAGKMAAVESPAEMIERRERLLGPAYRLFYERPVHLVRGEGVRLYDAEGRAYLDAYNNVPLVGHCHPRVVEALANQAATLNTHTRYLHATVLDYAERLLAHFPDYLDRVMFSCTGSEANELAVRVARAATGNRGVLVTANAYHGNTTAIAQVSPSNKNSEPRAPWVETLAAPDPYRRPEASLDELRAEWLTEVDRAIEALSSRGMKPAALLLDSGLSSDGMLLPPSGFVAGAVDRVRRAGGVFIGDEVQTGFARLGAARWGFEVHDAEPEIVTLGKPIGNGHPLAATVMRADVLEEFAARTRYFNTFGGNPVSAAVGLAVLEAFEVDGLEKNAKETGAYLHERLTELAETHEQIGEVRGSGLFAGVDLVEDRAARKPHSDLASRVVNGMRERRVLISATGPRGNVLKVRPPLPFGRAEVDELVAALDGTLAAERAAEGGDLV